MSVTSPDPRITEYAPVVPTTDFPATFPVFDNDDIKVFVNGVERDDFAVSAIYLEGISNDAKAVFAIGVTGSVQVVGVRDPRRTNRFSNGGPLPNRDINLALDTVEAELQEFGRDRTRSLKVGLGKDEQAVPDPEPGKLLGWSVGSKLANMAVSSTEMAFGPIGGDLAVALTREEAQEVIGLPDKVASTFVGISSDGLEYELLSSEGTLERLDPSSQLLRGEGLKLTYHKARSSWHVKAFGSSLTEVGTGSVSADMAAMQAALNSDAIIDLTGTVIRVDDLLTSASPSKTIMAGLSNRPGSTTRGDSGLLCVNPALPTMIKVTGINFEASGFYMRAESGNNITTAFWFERPTGGPRDIDARLHNMGLSLMARAVYHKGRGLECDGCLFSELRTAAIDLDQVANGNYTPTGSLSIDGTYTGTRGYRFNNNRYHAAYAPFVRNTGALAINNRGMEINGLIADIGCVGGVFSGVAIDVQMNDIQCRYGSDAGSLLLNLAPGSRDVNLTNFNASGYRDAVSWGSGANSGGDGAGDGGGNRMADRAIVMTSSAALPIRDIRISNGTIANTLKAGVEFQGDGAFDEIVFMGVSWRGIGVTSSSNNSRNPILVGPNVTSTRIKLVGCHGRQNVASLPFLRAENTPASNKLFREASSSLDASFSAWGTAGVVQPTTPTGPET